MRSRGAAAEEPDTSKRCGREGPYQIRLQAARRVCAKAFAELDDHGGDSIPTQSLSGLEPNKRMGGVNPTKGFSDGEYLGSNLIV